MPTRLTCVLCDSRDASWEQGPNDLKQWRCLICGGFSISFQCQVNVSNSDQELKPFLSAATRQAHEQHRPLTLTLKNYISHAESHRWTSVSAKARKILEFIRSRTSFFGQEIPLTPSQDYPLFDAISPEECTALLVHLRDKQLLTKRERDQENYFLTMEGW